VRRKRDRRVAEVGREDEPWVPGEAERFAAGLVEPPECAESKSRVLAAQPERGTVQGKERGRVAELGLDAVAAPVSRLGEPRWRGRSTTARSVCASPGGRPPGTPREAKTYTGAGPGDRHAAAVAAWDGAVATEEPRIPAVLGGDVGDLGQAQLLALVDVGRPG
jgi:hypothetical protein